MANLYNYGSNQSMINQLLRQKDNIDNMIQQYSQPQPPVQNIINTAVGLDFEARILKDDEDVETIFINRKTMFLDKKNKRVLVKDTDGKILEQYEIVIPLDEKDKKILELNKKLEEMERRINEYSKPFKSNDDKQQSYANGDELIDTTTEATSKSIQKSTKR